MPEDNDGSDSGYAADKLLHRFLVFFDGFDELKLRAAAIEVVAGAMNSEISVTAEEIRKKTDANFESN